MDSLTSKHLLEYQNEELAFKVLITTSGLGSRLGELTKFTNKSLITVGNKPALSHIIESYPRNITFVITLGHFGSHVRQFLELAYPDRNFEFTEVPKFSGPGSNLAFSMLQARKHLQCPFIFHVSDSLVGDVPIPRPSVNWVGGYKGWDSGNYASFDTVFNSVSKFHNKGMVDYDYLYVGLLGIFDFQIFWECLQLAYDAPEATTETNDVAALRIMQEKGFGFQLREFRDWVDVGNSHSLKLALSKYKNSYSVLPKVSESISFIDNSVVKFFSDSNVCTKRVNRAKTLKGLVPEIKAASENFFSYDFIDGVPFSEVRNPRRISELLTWSSDHLWTPVEEVPMAEFQDICKQFYTNKTIERLDLFEKTRGIPDKAYTINDEKLPAISEMIDEAMRIVNSDLRQVGFHGDFVLDNIMVTSSGNFVFIDWRQDFASNKIGGDIYYDLSKLNHSLFVNHGVVLNNQYQVEISHDNVKVDILMYSQFAEMQNSLHAWIKSNGLSWEKVNVLTSLIWLNMAPLHHHPFDTFLYFYGIQSLWRSLNEKGVH